VKLGGFRPAKINFFEPGAGLPTYVKAKGTKQNYIKYPGENYSAPFGALSDNEEEAAAAKLVKTAVLALSTKDYRRAWYNSERHRV
jgi:hypothetical protein